MRSFGVRQIPRRARAHQADWLSFLVVPIAVSLRLFMIADLDSPRGGAIRVTPQNLSSLS